MAEYRHRLEDLEKRRVELEKTTAKLRATVLHWQAWEIEYEGLKEEILELGEEPTLTDIEDIANHDNFVLGKNPEPLLTRKEKSNVLRNEKGVARSRDQILNLLSRRIDYVQQNVKTSRSLLKSAEEKLIATDVLKDAKAPNEEGLPLTEIHEELDEDSNVIASSTSVPGQAAINAVEAIEQAARNSNVKQDDTKEQRAPVPAEEARAMPGKLSPVNPTYKTEPSGTKSEPSSKKVSFVDGADDVPIGSIASDHKASEQILLKEISDREADELERIEMAESVIPDHESPEDTALRRQMIQYNMDEVGAIVAEIDMEDDLSSASEYDGQSLLGDEDEVDDEASEEEDNFGRTSRSKPLDEAYVKHMQALSDKLKADAMINVGPNYPTEAKQEPDSSVPAPNEGEAKRTPQKKGVRFAEQLDIQEAPEVSVANLLAASSAMTGTPISQAPTSKRAASAEAPMEDVSSVPKKVSKFKAARAQAASNATIAKTFNATPKAPIPPKPPSKILADTLVERPFTGVTSTPPAPDETEEFAPGQLKNEISTEYHRLRNRQVHREGGFIRNSDDQAEIQVAEEEGGPKKMSRFKAARLGLR